MKKLFGGINLTWKKLIIFAIIAGVYTALMALIPITKDTSFRDIAIFFEWWIFFGILIICNSKSPLDSALKCFVFFLISQPLVYLIQVPFSNMGWRLFGYYRYWFYWTLACLPMGYIGYYINKKNIISMIILAPMMIFLVLLGLGYINSAIESFPQHLLSGISCFAIITVVILNIFDNKKLRIASFGIVIISLVVILLLRGGLGDSKFETYRNLDDFNITIVGNYQVVVFTGTKEGNVEVIDSDEYHPIKLSGWYNGNYSFTISDEEENTYDFEYYFDKENNTVELIKK